MAGRYALFAGHCYYPRGGLCDLQKTWWRRPSEADVKAFIAANETRIANRDYVEIWFHVADLWRSSIVAEGQYARYLPYDAPVLTWQWSEGEAREHE